MEKCFHDCISIVTKNNLKIPARVAGVCRDCNLAISLDVMFTPCKHLRVKLSTELATHSVMFVDAVCIDCSKIVKMEFRLAPSQNVNTNTGSSGASV